MKGKTNLVLLIALFISTLSYSQDYKKDIEKRFNQYLEAIINKEFEQSLDYTIEELFDFIPKEMMIKAMEQSFNNPDLAIELSDPKILGIGEIKEIEGKYYVKLSYSNVMKMKYQSEESLPEDEEQDLNFMKGMMESTFGKENVTYDQTTGFFRIYSQKEVYCISKTRNDDWKFMVVEKKQRAMLEQLLPTSIVKEIFEE